MRVLRLEVLTPEATVFAAEIEVVIVPLSDGWCGIFPGHASFQARLMRGEILFRTAGQEHRLSTLGGSLMVHEDTVTILTGVAARDLTPEALEQEISGQAQRLADMEQEAEKHFERVYRQMAHTFTHRRRPHA